VSDTPSSDAAVDLTSVLHDARTGRVRDLPQDARVILSGGAAGRWYFDWFEHNYAGDISRHIGVEALTPMPDALPGHVEWLSSTLGNLGAIPTGSVDLVFAGEVIEHLWPGDISSFLIEAHRVLAPGGCIALDSPNRSATQAIQWLHPEHTVEFSVDEIAELLELASFDEISIQGLVRAYDAERHRFLKLDEIAQEHVGSEKNTSVRPEDAFLWWAQARRRDADPQVEQLHARVRDLFRRFRSNRLTQLSSKMAWSADVVHSDRIAVAGDGEAGPLLYGPYLPMPAGAWTATFELRLLEPSINKRTVVASANIVSDAGERELAMKALRARALSGNEWTRTDVQFELQEAAMGVEFKLITTGAAALEAKARVDVQPYAQTDYRSGWRSRRAR